MACSSRPSAKPSNASRRAMISSSTAATATGPWPVIGASQAAEPRQRTPMSELATKPRSKFRNICFLASDTEPAREAAQRLGQRYGQASADQADVIVPLGGDGFML